MIKSLSFLHIARLEKKIRFKDKATPLLVYFKTLLLLYQRYKLEVDKLHMFLYRFLGISGIIPLI